MHWLVPPPLSSEASQDTGDRVDSTVTDPPVLEYGSDSGEASEEQFHLRMIRECLFSVMGQIPSKNLGEDVLDHAISLLPGAHIELLDQHASQFLWERRQLNVSTGSGLPGDRPAGERSNRSARRSAFARLQERSTTCCFPVSRTIWRTALFLPRRRSLSTSGGGS